MMKPKTDISAQLAKTSSATASRAAGPKQKGMSLRMEPIGTALWSQTVMPAR